MSETTKTSWEKHTVIEEDELQDYIFNAGEWEENKLRVNAYCIRPNVDTLNVDGFIEFLRNQFPRFVFSQSEIESREWPGLDAIRMTRDKDPTSSGDLGELILFVLVDGLLNLPIVCHKVSLKQDPIQEVKGADGLFFGQFNGDEALAIGESKFKKKRSDAIKEALKSTDRFHAPDKHTKTRHELDVAARTLSDDLSEEELRSIIEALSPKPSDHRIIHPIFVGYKDKFLEDFQEESSSPSELKEKIRERVRDSELHSYIKEKIESEYDDLRKHWLIFFLFPVEDPDDFKDQLQEAIYQRGSN